jgi:hypothetical protein
VVSVLSASTLAVGLWNTVIRVDSFDGLTPFYDQAFKKRRRARSDRPQRLPLRSSMVGDTTAPPRRSLRHLHQTWSSTSPRKVACVTLLRTRALTCNPTTSAHSTCSKAFERNLSSNADRLDQFALRPSNHHLCRAATNGWIAELYAASKKATEVKAHAHAHLWSMPRDDPALLHSLWPMRTPYMAPLKICGSDRSRHANQYLQQRRHEARSRLFMM